MQRPASDLGMLLWSRINAAHVAMGAPTEDLADPADLPLWTFFDLGYDGVLGIKACPERDGDQLLVALPSNGSRLGSKRTVQIMKAWTATGRALYSSAWSGHHLAVRINRHMGAHVLGLDSDGFIQFKHTSDSLRAAAATRGQPHGEEKHAEGS